MMAPVLCKAPRILPKGQRISNISFGGVRVYTDERLYVKEQLELEFFLPDGSTVEAVAKVIWIQDMLPGSEALYDVGLEFVELAEEAKKKLKVVLEDK